MRVEKDIYKAVTETSMKKRSLLKHTCDTT